MSADNQSRNYMLRACSGLSLISAFMLIIICMVIFVCRIQHFSNSDFHRKLNKTQINSEGQTFLGNSTDQADRESDLEEERFQEKYLIGTLDKFWDKNRQILMSNSVVGVLCGLLQAIFSSLVLLSSGKAILLYVRKWMIINLILIWLLIIILVTTAVLTEHQGNKAFGKKLKLILKKYVDGKIENGEVDNLFKFLEVDEKFIYVSVGIDLAIILGAMGTAVIVLRKSGRDSGYEECE